ncbi:hypothetical protein BH09MYX1_BH09MYX1_42490 [soil metagenome]
MPVDESLERDLFARRARIDSAPVPDVALVLARAACGRRPRARPFASGGAWSRVGAAIAAIAACFALVHGLPTPAEGDPIRPVPRATDALDVTASPIVESGDLACGSRSATFSFAAAPRCEGEDDRTPIAIDYGVSSSTRTTANVSYASLSCVSE